MSSVVDQLFFNKYWMQVEERAFHTKESLELFGIEGVHSEEDAVRHMSTLRTVRLTIVDLADLYHDGYSLKFVNIKDAPLIYDILDRHLADWATVTNRHGFIHSIPPIEDFEKLDSLARLLHPFRDMNNALTKLAQSGLASIFNKRIVEHQDSMYKSYVPKLYEYCAKVHTQ